MKSETATSFVTERSQPQPEIVPDPGARWDRARRRLEEITEIYNNARIEEVESRKALRIEMDRGVALTNRQREILAMLRDGYSGREIANELGISYRTVKFHITIVLEKYGAKNCRTLIENFEKMSLL